MKEALGRLGNGGPVHRGFLTPVSIIGEVDMDLVSSKATGTFIGMTATRPQRDDRIETMPELVLLDACVCVCVCACMHVHAQKGKETACCEYNAQYYFSKFKRSNVRMYL